jgi:transcriptional regulator with XRE-family HTH domain
VKYAQHSNSIKKFGIRLREVRKSKGLSQEKLAYKADLELSQINRIELGKIATGLTQIFKICEALEIEPIVLFDFSSIQE